MLMTGADYRASLRAPEAMKREIWRNYPVMDKVALVEDLLDRGVLDDGQRVSKQPGRCCPAGCELPALPRDAPNESFFATTQK